MADDALAPTDPDTEALDDEEEEDPRLEEEVYVYDDEDDEEEEEDGQSPADEKDGPAVDAAQADADSEAPGDDDEQTDDDEDPAAAQAAQEEPAAETKEEGPAPFTFTVDKQSVPVERAQVFRAKNDAGEEEEFLLIPASEWRRTVQPRLADRGEIRKKELGLLRTIAERDPANNVEVVRAREAMRLFEEFLSEKDEDALLEKVDRFRADRDAWEATHKDRAHAQQLEALKGVTLEPEAAEIELQVEHATEQLQASLGTQLEAALARPEFAGLDRDEIAADLWELRNQLFFEAAEDMPEIGLREGEIGIDLKYLGERLTREAARHASIRDRAAKAAEVRTRNDKQLGRTGNRAPAAIGGRGGVTPGETRAKEPETYREWRENFLAPH
jgi:hypothetical protein